MFKHHAIGYLEMALNKFKLTGKLLFTEAHKHITHNITKQVILPKVLKHSSHTAHSLLSFLVPKKLINALTSVALITSV